MPVETSDRGRHVRWPGSVLAQNLKRRGNRMLLYHFAQAFAGTVAVLWVILLLKERVKVK